MSSFLGPSEQIRRTGANSLLLVAPLDRTQFRQEMFQELGVPCPPKLLSAVDKRRADFLAGRALAQSAMMQLNLPVIPIPIGPNRAPAWPKGVTGSISHTEKWCAAFLCTQDGHFPGVDIEADLTDRALRSVEKIVLTPPEHKIIAQSGVPAPRATAAVFSGKETLFKALYPLVGHVFGFEAARLIALNQTRLRFVLTKNLTDDLYAGQEFQVSLQEFPGHILTWLIHHNTGVSQA